MSAHDLNDTQTTTNHVALAAIGSSFLAIMGLTFPFVSMQLRSPLPYMATPRHKVERALKFLLKRPRSNLLHQSNSDKTTDATKLQTFVDLGSGDGTTIFAAASLSYKSTGIELNPTLYAISSIRRLFQPSHIRTNTRFIHGDMFQSTLLANQLNKADCVMVFGVNSLMPKIADLIESECRRGTLVMSYRFRLPLYKQSNKEETSSGENAIRHTVRSGVIDASLIYEEEEMRVYELDG